ncbi:MAG: phage terminase large subunit [Clostridia bacterium]|nr:phage terminase large subunit [Clostridia bacterium]
MGTARVIKISGKPSAKQSEFFASRAKYTAYGGARGGGKSWALRRKLVGLCLNYSGIKCLLVRRSLGEVKSNHLAPLISEYGGILKYNDGERAVVFGNGSRIIFGYCSCDRDVLRYQGQEYDVIAIDEATQLSEYQFSIFRASLRGVNDFPKRMYLTCNPGGIGHSWVKRLFIDRDFREDEDPIEYNFVQALVYDNKVLLNSDPSYVKQLKALPKRLRDAWLYGRWDVFEGQFFSEFCEEQHVVGADFIPKNTKRFLAFDYGFDMLAALILAKDPKGNLYVEGELCVPNLTLGEAAERIVKFIGDTKIEYAVAPPDLWNRRQDSGKSGFEIMQSVFGMPPMTPADNRRIPGWRVLKEYLSAREGKGRLYICRSCETLIRSMQGLLCDKERFEDAAGEPHALTHAPEALRYAVMTRFEVEVEEKADNNFTFLKKKSSVERFLDY